MAISLSGLTAGMGDVYSGMLSGSSSFSANSLMGTSTLLSDYASIKNGSYGKMLQSYYSKLLSDDSDEKTTSTTKAGKDAITSSAANTLYKSASALENLNYSEDNIDKIYDNVSTFIKDYNSMIKNASNSSVGSVASQANILNDTTYSNYKLLVKAGITMNADRTLSINEDTFKKANMSTLKTLFKGNSSYASRVSAKASQIYRYATNGSSMNYSYSSNGTYSSLNTSPSINSLL